MYIIDTRPNPENQLSSLKFPNTMAKSWLRDDLVLVDYFHDI